MARPLRIEYEGAFYHIVQRGIERRDIFKDHTDKRRFLAYLNLSKERYQARIHSYALMDNHYHLILETPRGNLSKIMHYINTSYAAYYNTKRRRVGPLYQGRYKAILVQADEHLKYLSGYIHLNPVRAKIVEDPCNYEWTSCRYFTKQETPPGYLDTEFILSMFGKALRTARKRYNEYMLEIIGEVENIIQNNLRKGIVLGDENFLKTIIENYIDKEEDAEIPVIRALKKKKQPELEDIKENVERVITEDRRLARRVTLYLCRKHTERSLKDIGAFLGDISDTGVSQAHKRVGEARERDNRLDRLIRGIEQGLEVSSVET